MHQIRVHLATAGFPIVGDKLYSGDGSEYLAWMEGGWNEDLERKLLMPRQALHAARLGIRWQGTEISWEAPLPRDIHNFISGKEVGFPAGVERGAEIGRTSSWQSY